MKNRAGERAERASNGKWRGERKVLLNAGMREYYSAKRMRRCPTPKPIPREYMPPIPARVAVVSKYLRENKAALSAFRRGKTQYSAFRINTLGPIIEGFHDDVIPRRLRARFRAAAKTAYEPLFRASNEIVGTAYEATRLPDQQHSSGTEYLKRHALEIENAVARTVRIETQLLRWLKRAQKRPQPRR